jgi:hypothetical protein
MNAGFQAAWRFASLAARRDAGMPKSPDDTVMAPRKDFIKIAQ